MTVQSLRSGYWDERTTQYAYDHCVRRRFRTLPPDRWSDSLFPPVCSVEHRAFCRVVHRDYGPRTKVVVVDDDDNVLEIDQTRGSC